jgi:transcriptional regulator with XRE-family HTH domain
MKESTVLPLENAAMPQTVMSPLKRRAAFKHSVALARITACDAARKLRVSYNHLMLVLNGDRFGSARVRAAIAEFLGAPESQVFGNKPTELLARLKACVPRYLAAGSWDDLEQRLIEDGLDLQLREGTLVITDGTYSVNASLLGEGFSFTDLRRRLGEYGPPAQ